MAHLEEWAGGPCSPNRFTRDRFAEDDSIADTNDRGCLAGAPCSVCERGAIVIAAAKRAGGWPTFAPLLTLRVPNARCESVGLLRSPSALVVPPLISIHWIDIDQHFSALLIERVAAPGPVLGIIHESTLQRIRVHVAELLDFLFPAPDIEVIETLLPELWQTLD